jgi:hypothetical protein
MGKIYLHRWHGGVVLNLVDIVVGIRYPAIYSVKLDQDAGLTMVVPTNVFF